MNTKKFVDAGQTDASSLRKAAITCRKLMREAERQAAELIKDAQEKAERTEKMAGKLGYEEGEKKALALLLDSERLRRRIVNASRDAIIDIALAVAREVIGEALQTQAGSIISRLDRALPLALNAPGVSIIASPAVCAEIERHLAQSRSSREWFKTVEVREDADIAADTFRIETAGGAIECSPHEHFEAIARTLANAGDILQLVPPPGSISDGLNTLRGEAANEPF